VTDAATRTVPDGFALFARAQPAAVSALQAAIAGDQVSHAWLLLGPAGSGQVEAARYLGAALNCTTQGARKAGVPCGKCSSCHRVMAGTHTAVRDFVPEGAMHRVADVRDEWVPAATRSTLDGRFKVMRIVAADRMNETAQNAFLKLLEEPPPSVVWILDVADDAALLDTIISRCRRLDVTPWSQDLLRERLDAWVQAGEGDPGLGSGAEVVKTPPAGRPSKKKAVEVAHLPSPSDGERAALVRLSKGSPQRLEELSTCDGRQLRQLSVTVVERIMELGPKRAGGAAPQIVNEVMDIAMAAKARLAAVADEELLDLGLSLGLNMEVGATGPKVKRPDKWPVGLEKQQKQRAERAQREAVVGTYRLFLDLLAAYLRDLLVAASTPGDQDALMAAVANGDRAASLRRASTRIDLVGLVEAMGAMEQAQLSLDLNGQPKLQLERAVIRIVLACARA
jgi:DNA polymerase-3 subunit delta'